MLPPAGQRAAREHPGASARPSTPAAGARPARPIRRPAGARVRRLSLTRTRAGLAGAALVLLAACEPAPQPADQLVLGGPTMGTTWSVKVARPPAGLDAAALEAGIAAVLEDVNARMSTYRPDSELSRFNASRSTDWQPASAELVAVVTEALAVSALSGGTFDVTVGPLVNLWGFGPEARADRVPADVEIEAARARVGHDKLEARREPPALRKARPDLYVDLSALAKGYGVDRVAAHLESAGASDYLAEVGGELRARGRNASGVPWRVAVERPVPGERAIERVLSLDGTGVATSGDYRNYFERDGVRYSHTIDPRTGRPIAHRLASATVLSERAMHADALATALMVLGPDEGLALAEREGLAVLLIVKDGEGFAERVTPAMQAAITE